MQRDLAILRDENRTLRTPATSQVIQAPRRAALTTTKVPRFDGTTSWEQYHQVFEAIVLTAHYGSPGRLADYRRHFERTIRTTGEDPANFATALEMLAVKAFGDMGQTARLRLIRDRFIAGHNSCDLRRHLDSALPETPIRDVADRCRIWENHADPAISRTRKSTTDPMYPTFTVGETDSNNEIIKVAAVTELNSDQHKLM